MSENYRTNNLSDLSANSLTGCRLPFSVDVERAEQFPALLEPTGSFNDTPKLENDDLKDFTMQVHTNILNYQ